MTEVRRRMAQGAVWLVLLRLADRSIGLVSTLILARLLVPADFGLVAMAMSVIAALEIMSAFSFDIALIQNRNATRHHYDTAWTLNVLFGLVNGCLLLALADPVAAFYKEPRVAAVMQCLALYVALQGFTNIGIVAFQKELELQKEFRLGILKKLVSFTVTIAAAWTWRSYWALIAGQLTSAAAVVALSYRLHPYRPRLSLAGWRELFRFSSWLLLNNVLTFLMHKTSDIVIGRSLGSASLGTYSVAYEISNLPTTELVFPISRAVFPGYSQLTGSLDELRRAFVDVLAVILLLVIPAGVALAALAEPIVLVLLGSNWTAAVPLVQLLALFGVLRASAATAGSMFLALGKPGVLATMTVLFIVTMALGFWLFLPRYGMAGAALGMLVAGCTIVPLQFATIARSLKLRAAQLLGVVWRPLAAGLIMAGALLYLLQQAAVAALWPLMKLLVLAPLGIGLYSGVTLLLWQLAGRPLGGEAYALRLGQAALRRLRAGTA